MNITSRASALHNPYLMDFVELVISGEINPIDDQVFVFTSGALAKMDLKKALPPELFEALYLKNIQRDCTGTTFVRCVPKVVIAILCQSMPQEVVQAITRMRDLTVPFTQQFHDVGVYMGPTSRITSYRPWPHIDKFSGPFDVLDLLRLSFESAPPVKAAYNPDFGAITDFLRKGNPHV